MKVIIGGSGFIGTKLSDILSENGDSNFVILDKEEGSKYTKSTTVINVLDYEALKSSLKGAKQVINLAAEHKDNVSPISLYYDVNVTGAENVCKACVENNINKIVFTSSVAVYGLNKPNPDEDFPADPSNHYGKSKYEAELVYKKWYDEDPENRCLIIIRPTVCFGEGNRGNVYNLFKQMSSGKFLRIGKGENRKSMAYVGNLASFLHYSAENFNHGLQIYNYVDSPDLTTNNIIKVCEDSLGLNISKVRIPYRLGYMAGLGFDLLSKVSGKELPISSVRIQKFCATTQFNAQKAHGTGFKAPYTLSEGIANTLKHEFVNSTED